MNKVYGCNVCLKTFTHGRSFRYHYKSHESPENKQEEKSLCNICTKLFSTSKILKAHLKTHDISEYKQERQTVCNVCSKTFANKHILKTRMNLHDPQSEKYNPGSSILQANSYDCDMCPLKLGTKVKLGKHMLKTHGNKHQVTCSYCMKYFSYASLSKHKKYCNMSKEEKNELKEKNKVTCGDCGKVVRDKTKLNRHMRFIHKQEKLFRCNHCKREDYSRENLKMHVKNCHDVANLDNSIININDA